MKRIKYKKNKQEGKIMKSRVYGGKRAEKNI